MRERGTHLHHEVEPVMPEMFGKEKGTRFKREATKRTVMTALGVKRVGEIKPAIEKLESKPLKEILRSQLATTEEFVKTPRGRDSLLKRNEQLIDLVAGGDFTKEEEKIANKFVDSIGRLIEKTREPEKPPEAAERLTEAAEKMAGAAEAQARVARGEAVLELPEGREQQRQYVRAILDRIEKSNRDCHDFSISTIVQRLEASLDDMDSEVAREARARLAVHDCSELIKQASGWIAREVDKVGPGHTIGSAISEAKRRNHELTRDMVSLFLRKEENKKENLPGLNVPKAWNLLQKANFEYEEYVKDKLEKGEEKPPKTYYTDPNAERRRAKHELLVEELGGGKKASKVADEAAQKSLQLAEKLTIATLETSVFNRASKSGNDQLAEAIYLKEWREGRKEKGRVRGPRIHEGAIPGFGTSWLRERSEEKLKEELARKIKE